MNEKEYVSKHCPYCGQMWQVEDEQERPELVCRCPGALQEQAREENTMVLLGNLEQLFGEECGREEPAFRPAGEEVYGILAQITDLVGHEQIGTVSFCLRDGTSGKISVKGIERKKNITRKLVK